MSAETPSGELYVEDVLAVNPGSEALNGDVLEESRRLRADALSLLDLIPNEAEDHNWALYRYTPDLTRMDTRREAFVYLYRRSGDDKPSLRIITKENYILDDGNHYLIDDYMVDSAEDVRHASGEVFFPGGESISVDALAAPYVECHDDEPLRISGFTVYPENQTLVLDENQEIKVAHADAAGLGVEQALKVLKQGREVLRAVVENEAFAVGRSSEMPEFIFRKSQVS